LDVLPLDAGIIADAVYANSTTMDGRHFAQEFIRRKHLAEKGVIERGGSEKQTTDGKAGASGSGWSEVAKKGSGGPQQAPVMSALSPQGLQQGQQQQPTGGDSGAIAGFKVVPSRKKGRK